MKWIGRKPNVWVHGGALLAGVIVLVCIVVWLSGPQTGRSSFVGNHVRQIITGGIGYSSSGPASSCYVRRTEQGFELIGDGSLPVDAVWHYKWRPFYVYTLVQTKDGFFAPTRTSIWHTLVVPTGREMSFPLEFQDFSDRYGLGLTPDENGQLTVDPQIKEFSNYSEDRTLWGGYVINVVAIMASIWILWALRWVPHQIRYTIQKRRYLRGLCPLCKYDVCATPDKCPECGWVHGGKGDEA